MALYYCIIIVLLGAASNGQQLPPVTEIMPPKSLAGDSAQRLTAPRAIDSRGPFIDQCVAQFIYVFDTLWQSGVYNYNNKVIWLRHNIERLTSFDYLLSNT